MRYARYLIAVSTLVVACQSYDFIFQPFSDRQGVHLRFKVDTPSKADILFVIDNSESMAQEQTQLAAALKFMLQRLAPLDTSYRIGIVSTDAHGFAADCNGNQ